MIINRFEYILLIITGIRIKRMKLLLVIIMMFIILLTILFGLMSIGVLYHAEAYTIVQSTYSQCKLMYLCAKFANVSKRDMLIKIIKFMYWIAYVTIQQKCNKMLRRISNDTYELTYVINGRLYRQIMKFDSSKKPICIVDDKDKDITLEVIPYMGPEYNWYNSKTPLKQLSLSKIVVYDNEGDEQIYETT